MYEHVLYKSDLSSSFGIFPQSFFKLDTAVALKGALVVEEGDNLNDPPSITQKVL